MSAHQFKSTIHIFPRLSFLTLAIFIGSSSTVFAQELPAITGDEIGDVKELPKVSSNLSIDGLNTSNEYPVCHRMKNGVAKNQIQTATTQTSTIE
jgi:hypothetical protein